MDGLKLDIGCGQFKKKGYIGIDILDIPGVDYVVDFRKDRLPFQDNSAEAVYSRHFLEHLEIKDIILVLEDIHRVCKHGAIVEIRVPHFSGASNFYEYHKTSFRYNSFREFILDEKGMFKGKVQFKLLHRIIRFSNRPRWNRFIQAIANKYPVFYENSFMRNLFPAFELVFIFSVVKNYQ